MLEARKLRFRTGALQLDYDFALPAGRLLLISGPSGAGKTSLLNLIAGFARPLAGDVLFGGEKLTPLTPQCRPVTMMFQEGNLFPHLTTLQNTVLGASPGLRPTPAQRDAARRALAEVGLQGLEDRLPAQLSGGQRQRAALARALLRDKPLLLLDEPLSGLDGETARAILNLLDQARRRRRLTVLLVSHAHEDVRADFHAVVRDGRLSMRAA